MFFRNLTLLRIPATFGGLFDTPVADELGRLDTALGACALKPVGATEVFSSGFIPPLGRDSEAYAHQVGNAVWLSIGSEEKLLPPAVVNDLLRKKLDEIEEKEGRRPGARARKRLKESLFAELLPRAFVQPGRTDAYIDLARGFIAVDTSSRRKAENVASEVRRAVGSFPALPINAESSPRAVLTGWLAGEPMPDGFSLGDECELREADNRGAVVRVQRLDLNSEEVAKHLEAGMQCARLALVWKDHVSFVLGEDLTLRKVKFLDGAVDQLENTEREDLHAELDARFVLMAGEIGELFDVLEKALQLSAGETVKSPAADAPTRAGARVQRAAKRLHDMARDQGVTMEIVTPGGEVLAMFGDGPDPLLDTARADVRSTGKASISGLQRRLKVGYNRAARLIEALQVEGLVSPPDDHGDRKVIQPEGTTCTP